MSFWSPPRSSKLLQNTLLLFISNLFAKATTALLFIFIARQLGPAEGGQFSLGVTYSLILMLPLIGLEDYLIREIVRDKQQTRSFLSNFLVLRLGMTTILIIGLCAALFNTTVYSEQTTLIVSLIALTAFSEGIFSTSQSLFFAHERFWIPVILSLFTMSLKTGGGLLVLFQGGNLINLSLVYLGASWLGAILSLMSAMWLAAAVTGSWQIDVRFCWRIVGNGRSFILMGLLVGLELQADIIILSFLTNETIVGWYSAATTIFVGLALLAAAYRVAVFPTMTRLASESVTQLFGLYEKSVYYIFFLSVPLLAAVAVLAPVILPLIYQENFEQAVPILQILVWALIFLFINVPNTRLLLVLDLQGWIPIFLTVSLLVNLILNYLLVPSLAGLGAAIARIVSTATYSCLTLLLIQQQKPRGFQMQFIKLMTRVLLAIASMVWVVYLLRYQTISILLIAMLAGYFLVAWVSGVVPSEDRRRLKELFL
ncbi:MAG: flippase [Chloroflexota bacterium]